MKRVVWGLLLALLGGCSPWLEIHQVNLGMAKAEVIQQMGKPTSASGAGNEEYLWYVPANAFWQKYYVRLLNGKVESYGLLEPKPGSRPD